MRSFRAFCHRSPKAAMLKAIKSAIDDYEEEKG